MARHDDIGRAHAIMDGTQWHIQGGNDRKTGKRRAKSKCIYYIRKINGCRKKDGGCQGAGSCAMYQE